MFKHLMLLEEPVLLELLEPEPEVLGVGDLDVVEEALLVVNVDAADLGLDGDQSGINQIALLIYIIELIDLIDLNIRKLIDCDDCEDYSD